MAPSGPSFTTTLSLDPLTAEPELAGREILNHLEAAGIRASVDERSEKVNLKIRDAQMQKIPYMLVVGDREAQSGCVAVRNRKHGDLGAKPLEQFIAELQQLIAAKAVSE